jgi:hypothetical protein
MTLLGGFSVWGAGELFAKSRDELYELDTGKLPGALGGAALGSLAAFGMAKLIYGDQPDADKDTGVVLLGAALVSSLSTFGYYFISSLGDDGGQDDAIVIDAAQLRPPVFQTSIGFTW